MRTVLLALTRFPARRAVQSTQTRRTQRFTQLHFTSVFWLYVRQLKGKVVPDFVRDLKVKTLPDLRSSFGFALRG